MRELACRIEIDHKLLDQAVRQGHNRRICARNLLYCAQSVHRIPHKRESCLFFLRTGIGLMAEESFNPLDNVWN